MQDQPAVDLAVAAKTAVGVGAAAAAAGNSPTEIVVGCVVALIAALANLHFEQPAKGTEVLHIMLRLFAHATVGLLAGVLVRIFIPDAWTHGKELPLWALAGVFSLSASMVWKRWGREVESRGAPGA